jgi:hypothetical protein
MNTEHDAHVGLGGQGGSSFQNTDKDDRRFAIRCRSIFPSDEAGLVCAE